MYKFDEYDKEENQGVILAEEKAGKNVHLE